MTKSMTKMKLKKGTCPSCYGKKFYTQMYSIRGTDDFGGERFETKPKIHKVLCPTCKGTGKKLKIAKMKTHTLKVRKNNI